MREWKATVLLPGLAVGTVTEHPSGEPCVLAAARPRVADLNDAVAAVVAGTLPPLSHVTEQAASMGIPVVTDVPVQPDWQGRQLLVDGLAGCVTLEPNAARVAQAKTRLALWREERRALLALRDAEDVTLGGRRCAVRATAACLRDVELAVQTGAAGIGLFRTEALFGTAVPDEETQRILYTAAAHKASPVTLRAMDFGGDKPFPGEPSDGLRGLGWALAHPSLLRTQLRAIWRVNEPLALTFPYVTLPDELEAAHALAFRMERELDAPFLRPAIGAMLETPDALRRADAFLAAFLYIGTNDLLRGLLAHYPMAEARRIALECCGLALEGARGRPVTICGALASDEETVPQLVKWGATAVVVPYASVLPVRRLIRAIPA